MTDTSPMTVVFIITGGIVFAIVVFLIARKLDLFRSIADDEEEEWQELRTQYAEKTGEPAPKYNTFENRQQVLKKINPTQAKEEREYEKQMSETAMYLDEQQRRQRTKEEIQMDIERKKLLAQEAEAEANLKAAREGKSRPSPPPPRSKFWKDE